MSRFRRLLVLNVAVVLATGFAVGQWGEQGQKHQPTASPCGNEGSIITIAGGPAACVHEDQPPAGVDVTRAVSTTELKARPGAGPAAYKAAQDLGVPSPVNLAVGVSSPAVECDGDGSSGFRVQPMYVVEAGKTNRYSSLLSSFQLWAAGTDDVLNRSAALSGGVRHIRYVTDPVGDGTCLAHVLNVTVPAGALANFNSTIQAIQALGYTSPARKYLMWTDATVLCGIATMYPGDTSAQSNPNNGSYAQYARVDSGCWGLGNGNTQHSVEAHELTHNLGGVQNSAPHSTQAGHCWDEADTMCYADGGTHAMVSICPSEREYLLDCNSDDYYSTFPDPGSYLDGHWNAANSQFLIGGGNGTSGGLAGSPTVLGAIIGVNNPAVPGLATQVSVTPSLPTGRTLTSVAWKSARTDCVFSAPTQIQSNVTCIATNAAATTVTATLVDSSGATKVVSSPLTFLTGTQRPVTVGFSIDGQSTSTVSMCTGAMEPMTATVTDVQSGLPIKGTSVTFTSQTAAQTLAVAVGTVTTSTQGSGTLSKSASVATTFVAKTLAGTVYAASTPVTLAATVGTCSAILSATATSGSIYYGDAMPVTGTLTRTVGGVTLPVGGVSLPINQVKSTTTNGVTTTTVTALATVKTLADGTFSASVKPTATSLLRANLAASPSFSATSSDAASVTVLIPSTSLTGAVDKTDVGYGSNITVTGTLHRIAGTSDTPLAGQTVIVKVTPASGVAVTAASGRVTTNGTFTIPVGLRTTGSLSVYFAGVTGQPAATTVVGPVVAGNWTPSIALTSNLSSVALGGYVTLNASVTKTYQSTTGPAASVSVKFYFLGAAPASVPVLAGTATTTAAGLATLRPFPKATGTYYASVTSVVGYTNATSNSTPITVA